MVRRFDVVSVGEVLWRYAVEPSAMPGAIDVISFGGAPWAALVLAKRGLRVGLATSLPSTAEGRRLLTTLESAGVDCGAIALTAEAPRLVVLDRAGEAFDRLDVDAEGAGLSIPPEWTSRVLFVSGLSPLVSRAAALTKAARAARRAGVVVVVDVNARWQLWMGQDSRAVQSILREADVVRMTTRDLATLGLDVDTIRAIMRPTAVLFMSQGADEAWVSGPFGHAAKRAPFPSLHTLPLEPDLYAAVICDELARAGTIDEGRGDLWVRALERGFAAVQAQARTQSR